MAGKRGSDRNRRKYYLQAISSARNTAQALRIARFWVEREEKFGGESSRKFATEVLEEVYALHIGLTRKEYSDRNGK